MEFFLVVCNGIQTACALAIGLCVAVVTILYIVRGK